MVAGPHGVYTVTWNNLLDAAATPTGALGLNIRSREALLATHVGSQLQREWLRTMPPHGGWDLLFPSADLGRPAAAVAAALKTRAASGEPA